MDLDIQALPNERLFDQIERNDTTFIKALSNRIDNLGNISNALPKRITTEFLFGEMLRERGQLTEFHIREELFNIAENITDLKVQNTFLDPDIKLRDLIGVLNFASGEEYRNFTNMIVKHQETSSDVHDFFISKFDNVLQYANTEEKILLIRNWIEEGSAVSTEAIASTLRSSKTMSELCTLVSFIDDYSLYEFDNEELFGYQALATLGSQISDVEFPAVLLEYSSDVEVAEAIYLLQSAMEKQLEVLISLEKFKETDCYSDFQVGIDSNIRFFENQLSNDLSHEETITLVNMMSLKMQIESNYSIRLSHQESFLGMPGAQWDIEKLSQVKTAFELLPEGVLLMTPRLSNIQIVSSIYGRQSILGLRRGVDGAILLAEHTFSHSGVEALYPDVGSGTAVLVHEIGHSVHLGKTSGGIKTGKNGKLEFINGDERYDFDEYIETNGWIIFEEESYELTNGGYSVKIEGREYLMETPVRLNDELVIIKLYGSTLIAYKAEGQFTIDPYGRVNPFEDWAEAFTEYFLNPKRLKKFAPKKFKHFQQEFS